MYEPPPPKLQIQLFQRSTDISHQYFVRFYLCLSFLETLEMSIHAKTQILLLWKLQESLPQWTLRVVVFKWNTLLFQKRQSFGYIAGYIVNILLVKIFLQFLISKHWKHFAPISEGRDCGLTWILAPKKILTHLSIFWEKEPNGLG